MSFNRKQRSRSGCNCCKKARIKCDETKPKCENCIRRGHDYCDYSIQLKWGKKPLKNSQKITKDLPDASFVDGILVMAKKRVKKSIKGVGANIESLPLESGRMLLAPSHVPNLGSSTLSNFVTSPALGLVCDNVSAIEDPDQERDTELADMVIGSLPRGSPLLVSDLLKDQVNFDHKYFNLNALRLAHPSPNILFNSVYYSELFGFYLRETSHLLVPTPHYEYRTNPFHTILPQMAMQSSTLMNLILAFGANHRKQIMDYQQGSHIAPLDITRRDESVANALLSQTFVQLFAHLTDIKQRRDNTTLATILMLAGFDIFFSDTRNKWRAHIFGARGLILDKLRTGHKSSFRVTSTATATDADTFLDHWFSYLNIIASLSSVKRNVAKESLRSLTYEFDYEERKSEIYERRLRWEDIDYLTGMETKVLSLLADIADLVDQKESLADLIELHPLLLKALDLDHNILTYLDESEVERDAIEKDVFDGRLRLTKLCSSTDSNYKTYKTLRAINMIFGLTGLLQLKRRVIGIPQGSPVIKDLLIRVTKLIEEWIPFNSSAESCITFCLFCCGCELVSRDLVSSRKIYMDHIEILLQNGMASAQQAKMVMEDCWKDKKSWWEILEERNLDLAFAI
ncbi:LANO_0A00342g1_1 [Lachancea nothofagi CBS 11611]|uniref:LANO_0A00342g1_1 n=1 Tax=Lachancea nothofagi CBS 11611 TaxID=1266666 RepID=A0A1G4IM40_9SACH|nr:LANO_0A00342g1_1 [Lachancea nothofagi CBS 11611]